MSPLAHCGVTTHFRLSEVLSKISGHQRHHSVHVEYSHLQVQFTSTEIKLFISLLFSSSFCLKYSLHFTGQNKYFTRSSQDYLPASKGYHFGDTKMVLLFLNLVKYSYLRAGFEPLLWGLGLGLIHLKENKHFCIAVWPQLQRYCWYCCDYWVI